MSANQLDNKRNSWDQKLISIISALTNGSQHHKQQQQQAEQSPELNVGQHQNKTYSVPNYNLSIDRHDDRYASDRPVFTDSCDGPTSYRGRVPVRPFNLNPSYASTLPTRVLSSRVPRRYQTADNSVDGERYYQENHVSRKPYYSEHDLSQYQTTHSKDIPSDYHHQYQHQRFVENNLSPNFHHRLPSSSSRYPHKHQHHQQQQQLHEGWFS